jgi:hypothetical protein
MSSSLPTRLVGTVLRAKRCAKTVTVRVARPVMDPKTLKVSEPEREGGRFLNILLSFAFLGRADLQPTQKLPGARRTGTVRRGGRRADRVLRAADKAEDHRGRRGEGRGQVDPAECVAAALCGAVPFLFGAAATTAARVADGDEDVRRRRSLWLRYSWWVELFSF